jgi:hypothetical protein
MDILLTIINSKLYFNNKEELIHEFKLPIEYIENKEISQNLKNDMELIELKNIDISINSNDDETNNSYLENLYYCLFEPKNDYEKKIVNKWSNLYTANKDFLLDSQELLKNFKVANNLYDANVNNNSNNNLNNNENIHTNITNNCEELFYNKHFLEKFNYIDLPYLDKYNENELVMECYSLYNFTSPLFSLLLPIISLLLPFFIIKLQGYNVSLELYFNHLKKLFANNVIGQLLTNFSSSPLSSKVYLILSLGMYIYQLYSNFINCTKYYKNFNIIHNTLFSLNDYLKDSLANINNLINSCSNLYNKTYDNFVITIKYHIQIINDYIQNIDKIIPCTIIFNNSNNFIKKLLQMGHIMKTFYKLYNDNTLIKSIYYIIDCNGYISNILNLQKHLNNNNINYCKFIENNENKVQFKNSYYGYLLYNNNEKNSKKIIKNSYVMDNNLILTGPNAAGKTTLLKSTLFNVLLSQQLGCGFYDSANIKLYDFIHCYINIPDTSNRDSLFQAEARQCKNILDIIESNKEKNHFCVFDELYSGTNPDEAVKSAYNYLKYLEKNNNINFILTTHYYKLCDKFKDNKDNKELKINTHNYHMQIKYKNNDYNYCYKLKRGISKVKGGVKVLKDMHYPEYIINEL